MSSRLLSKAPAYRGQSARITHRWFVASSAQIKVMFGLRPEQKWPNEGMTDRVIDGVRVWVVSRLPYPGNGRRGRGGIRHRAMCACPVCGDILTLGRLGQHITVHQDYEVPTNVA